MGSCTYIGEDANMVMKEDIIRKYVRDLDGLLKEIRSWEKEGTVLHQTYPDVQQWMYEQGIVFLFGRLYRFFNFGDIILGSNARTLKGLDGVVSWGKEIKELEFEVLSSGFDVHILRGDVKPDDYKNTIIVCWEHKWKECPSDIDVIEFKHFWELAKKTVS